MGKLVRKLTRAFRSEMYIPYSGSRGRDDSDPCSKLGDWGIFRMAFMLDRFGDAHSST